MVEKPVSRFACLALLLFSCVSATAQWQTQPSHSTESLRGVSAYNAKIAWASGTHGTVLLTLDGGDTWTIKKVPGAETLDFRGVKSFASDVYLLAAGPGDQSRIYHSSDRGDSWQLQFTNPDPKGFFDCMTFSDARHGMVVGDPIDGKFRILRTHDAGKSWKYIDSRAMPPAREGESAFAASNSCMATQGAHYIWFGTGGPAARVFRSSDGGKHWAASETPIMHGESSAGIFSIAFQDAQHGVIAGGDYQRPELGGSNIATTSDGGKTWTLSSITPQKYFSAIRYLSQNQLLAVGSSGSAFSQDGLTNWKFFSTEGFNAVDFVAGEKFLYSVGSDGRIARTKLLP